MNKDIVLKLTGITRDYHQGRSLIEVLKDVNLEVKSGQMIAIVGASGSGKSTLLHIAGLLDIPTKGKVEILGNSFEKQSLDNAAAIRLNNLGFIYQYHHLLKDFTAQENAAMPLIIQGINKAEALDRAEVILSDLGLGKRLYNVPGELSGGEQQRVAIARAFINKPKIVLADEPTGNLDPHTAEDVFNMFIQRAQNDNVAIIMVTHNMAIANRLSKIYKLDYSLLEVEI